MIKLQDITRASLLYCPALTDTYIYAFSSSAGGNAQHLRTIFIGDVQYYIDSLCKISKTPEGPYTRMTQSERKKVSYAADPGGEILTVHVSEVVTPWFDEQYHGTPRHLAEGVAELYLRFNPDTTPVTIDAVEHQRIHNYTKGMRNLETLYKRGTTLSIDKPDDVTTTMGFEGGKFYIKDSDGIALRYPGKTIELPFLFGDNYVDVLCQVLTLITIVADWPMEPLKVVVEGRPHVRKPSHSGLVEESEGDELEHWRDAILRRVEHMLNLPDNCLNRVRITHGVRYTHLRLSGPSEKLDIYLQEGVDKQVCIQSTSATVLNNEVLSELVRRSRVVLDNRIAVSITEAILSNNNTTNIN